MPTFGSSGGWLHFVANEAVAVAVLVAGGAVLSVQVTLPVDAIPATVKAELWVPGSNVSGWPCPGRPIGRPAGRHVDWVTRATRLAFRNGAR
jgi:hypothetical protein